MGGRGAVGSPPPRVIPGGGRRRPRVGATRRNEQALVSLKLTKTIDAVVGRTFAVIIEGG